MIAHTEGMSSSLTLVVPPGTPNRQSRSTIIIRNLFLETGLAVAALIDPLKTPPQRTLADSHGPRNGPEKVMQDLLNEPPVTRTHEELLLRIDEIKYVMSRQFAETRCRLAGSPLLLAVIRMEERFLERLRKDRVEVIEDMAPGRHEGIRQGPSTLPGSGDGTAPPPPDATQG